MCLWRCLYLLHLRWCIVSNFRRPRHTTWSTYFSALWYFSSTHFTSGKEFKEFDILFPSYHVVHLVPFLDHTLAALFYTLITPTLLATADQPNDLDGIRNESQKGCVLWNEFTLALADVSIFSTHVFSFSRCPGLHEAERRA